MYLQQCLLLLFCPHQRGNKTLVKTNPTPPHLPSHAGFLKTRTRTIKKKSIQHSPNKCADKTRVGIWICETTIVSNRTSLMPHSHGGCTLGTDPQELQLIARIPGNKGQLFSASAEWEFSVVPSNLTKASTTCSWHGCPMQTGPLARWPVLPSPSVLPHNKDKWLPLLSR